MSAPASIAPAAFGEPPQTSGLTSRMLLAYVERQGGREAVDALLAECGLSEREALLRDENHWFGFETKVRMFEAAAEVLDDPDVTRHMGEAAPDLNVGAGIKVALRAFGSPRLVYANIVNTAAKFTWAHTFEVDELGPMHARLRYIDVSGVGYHRHDCQYNVGLLSVVPVIFGQAPAQVRHDECALHGADCCVYELSWGASMAGLVRIAAGWAGASVAALAGAALLAPALLPVVGALPLAGGAFVARRATWTRRRRWENLEQRVRDQKEMADRLSASLEDLVSDLRLHDVLEKITHHARAAVGGKEFVLLAPGDDGYTCLGSSGVAPGAIEVLERWADATPDLTGSAVSLDDLREVPELATLARQRTVAFGSLHAAPLTFRGNNLGVLVALAHGPSGFLPVDVTLLQSYAAQASIALANAHMVERLERLASQDPLTGLLNHREFHEGVARELERARRCGARFSVVLVDLDDFKRVNDEEGHAAGDQVLRQVAGAILESCRAYDSGFRIGGDEFALVLPETDAGAARAVAERVERTIEERRLPVRATCGVAEYPREAPTRELLLARADADLYAAKRARAAEERARAFAGADGSRRAAEVRDFEHRRRVAGGRLNGGSEVVRRLLATAREQLGLDVALLNEFLDDRLVVRAVEGGEGWLAIEPEITFPLEETFCLRVTDGRIPSLIADVQRDPRLSRLALVSETDIGSYLGVPVLLSDGSVYGTLALLGRDPAHDLGERDVSLARALAALTAGELERGDRPAGEDSRLKVEVTGVHALIAALDARDRYTGKHSKTVVELSSIVARSLALSEDEVAEVEQVAMLHDIGKVGIPDSVLHKEAPLDDDEWAIMREHPVIGARIISAIDGLAHLAPLIRAEHECWDGSGYPDGLAGADIPIASRIVFACDAYHAMTSDRPYRQALSASAAVDELRRCAGRQFDPAVAAALVQVLQPVAA